MHSDASDGMEMAGEDSYGDEYDQEIEEQQ